MGDLIEYTKNHPDLIGVRFVAAALAKHGGKFHLTHILSDKIGRLWAMDGHRVHRYCPDNRLPYGAYRCLVAKGNEVILHPSPLPADAVAEAFPEMDTMINEKGGSVFAGEVDFLTDSGVAKAAALAGRVLPEYLAINPEYLEDLINTLEMRVEKQTLEGRGGPKVVYRALFFGESTAALIMPMQVEDQPELPFGDAARAVKDMKDSLGPGESMTFTGGGKSTTLKGRDA